MKRRDLLAAPGGTTLLAAPLRADARTIGWISPESRGITAPFFVASRDGLLSNARHPGEENGIAACQPDDIQAVVGKALDAGAQVLVVPGWSNIAQAGGLPTYGPNLPASLLAQADGIIE